MAASSGVMTPYGCRYCCLRGSMPIATFSPHCALCTLDHTATPLSLCATIIQRIPKSVRNVGEGVRPQGRENTGWKDLRHPVLCCYGRDGLCALVIGVILGHEPYVSGPHLPTRQRMKRRVADHQREILGSNPRPCGR